jgi:hypothetical protein
MYSANSNLAEIESFHIKQEYLFGYVTNCAIYNWYVKSCYYFVMMNELNSFKTSQKSET